MATKQIEQGFFRRLRCRNTPIFNIQLILPITSKIGIPKRYKLVSIDFNVAAEDMFSLGLKGSMLKKALYHLFSQQYIEGIVKTAMEYLVPIILE